MPENATSKRTTTCHNCKKESIEFDTFYMDGYDQIIFECEHCYEDTIITEGEYAQRIKAETSKC